MNDDRNCDVTSFYRLTSLPPSLASDAAAIMLSHYHILHIMLSVTMASRHTNRHVFYFGILGHQTKSCMKYYV